MRLSFYYYVDTSVLIGILFLLMVAAIVLGRWLSRNRYSNDHFKNPGNAAMLTSLYALLGLLLAFTFGMSGERFRQRRLNIVDEAIAIETAALRQHLYTDSVRPYFQRYFREYLDARVAYFDAKADTSKIRIALNQSQVAGNALWDMATFHFRQNVNHDASVQMVPALNQMFATANSRFWSELNRTPSSILTLLFLLCIAAAFAAGHASVGEVKFNWAMSLGFCALISSVIYFIIDLDRARSGAITLEQNAKAISDLRRVIDKTPTPLMNITSHKVSPTKD
jgi:hypothetical protein